MYMATSRFFCHPRSASVVAYLALWPQSLTYTNACALQVATGICVISAVSTHFLELSINLYDLFANVLPFRGHTHSHSFSMASRKMGSRHNVIYIYILYIYMGRCQIGWWATGAAADISSTSDNWKCHRILSRRRILYCHVLLSCHRALSCHCSLSRHQVLRSCCHRKLCRR